MKNQNTSSPLLPNYTIFVKPDLYDITNKQYEEMKRYAEFIQWARRNPVYAIEQLLGIELMDYQKYVLMMTWISDQAVWCMSRNAGKSILGAIYIMMRSLLINDHQSYIITPSGSQSQELFQKIEKLVKNQNPSFASLTNVYANEIKKSQARSDGFVHDPSSYHYKLYNGSEVHTLNSNVNNLRSRRSNLNYYDEMAFLADGEPNMYTATMPFVTQSSQFVLGVGFDETDILAKPLAFPNQMVFSSSAGNTDQMFFDKYKECSIRMDAGDRRYFCADIDCDVVLKATMKGVPLPVPLLTEEKIESEMRRDRLAALREFKNIFQSEGGEGQLIKRSEIIRNSFFYAPELENIDNNSLYMLAWDPARMTDNSVCAIARFYEDPAVGWKARIVNCVLLMDLLSKRKRMKSAPNQIEEIKQLLINYNGEKAADYEHIHAFYVDAGSGGAGIPLTDWLADDFYVEDIKHRGLIDSEMNDGADSRNFPNAVRDKLRLISPIKYRSDMFEAAQQMVTQNLIEFPETYNYNGYINLIYEVHKDGSRVQRFTNPDDDDEKRFKKDGITIDYVRHELDQDEEVALMQIEAMKTEIVNMYRFKSSTGKDKFELAPDKVSILHDDRNYTFIMIAYALQTLRRKNITSRSNKTSSADLVSMMPIRRGQRNRMIG